MNVKTEKKPDLGLRFNFHVQKSGSKLWQNRDATGDIKFKVEGNEISAHKCILASLSPKFERQFYGDFDDKDKQVIDVNEESVTAAAFKEFLQFFYLDKVQLRHENIEGVLFLAKESLVEEFYDECVKYMREALSIENVCLSYYLALLYESNALIESCENLIRSKTMEVFATDGFINCSQLTLSNILQLVPQSCKTTDIFEACISWAKQYCAQNGINEENNEHLRAAIGDVLYRINFGKMTIGEFMRYYKPYKSLFTDEERDEILSMIGGVSDFQPKWFVDSTKEIKTQSLRTWDEDACVICNISLEPNMYITTNSLGLLFSCNRELLLGGFYCHEKLRETVETFITVQIAEMVDSAKTIVFSETQEFTFHFRCGHRQYVNLDSHFLMKPETKYRLLMRTSKEICIGYYHLSQNCNETLNKNTIVTIYPSGNSGIIGLKLNV